VAGGGDDVCLLGFRGATGSPIRPPIPPAYSRNPTDGRAFFIP